MKKRKSFLRRGSKVKNEDEQMAAAAALAAVASLQHEENQDDTTTTIKEKEYPPNFNSILPNNTSDELVSVNQACDRIWKCTQPQQAAAWLEILHRALLLRKPLDSNHYIPSDVFVCISGAALRFHNNDDDDNSKQDNHDHHIDFLLWHVWEEALWAAAALARVCVGAAWRFQLKQRHSWIRQGKIIQQQQRQQQGRPLHVVPTESTTTNDNDARSHLHSWTLASSHNAYPSIPENLPAAMLRFAAMEMPFNNILETNDKKWLDRLKSLAEAQRELVLALCYLVPKEEEETNHQDELEWTILEAHEPVATMVLSWLSTCVSFGGIVALIDKKPAAVPSRDSVVVESENDIDGSSKSVDTNVDDCSETQVSAASATITKTNADDCSENRQSAVQPRDSKNDARANPFHKYLQNGGLDSIDIDWWTALQVVRAVFQLVSAGWRIPQNQVGEEIIAYIVEFAQKGMILRTRELESFGVESDRVTREERLAASSSAMTCISILSAIASVGLIPATVQYLVTLKMCRLQVKVTDSNVAIADLFPSGESLSVEEQQEWEADYQTFLEQREDCASDLMALYWVLLAQSSSAAAAMVAFSEMMNFNSNIGETCSQMSHSENLHAACIAVDAVTGALWGKLPDMPGITHLRIYWCDFLKSLTSIAFRVHEWIVELDGTWAETQENDKKVAVHDSLLLLLQVVSSMKQFVEEELLRGNGLLAPDEWDAIVKLLDDNVYKWLCMTDKTAALASETEVLHEIRSEVGMLLDGLADFFDVCTRFESSAFNLVVEDECRVKLYSLLLQKAVPLMTPEKGTSLALAILRCWCATDFAIHKSDTWARTASYIITEVFAMFEDQSFGLYHGYAHSPAVRLESLRLVALGEEDELVLSNAEQFAASELLSPLEQSLYFREQYLALVNGALLPPLLTMFGAQSSNIHVAVVIPLPTASFSSNPTLLNEDIYGEAPSLRDWKQTTVDDSDKLRHFAVKVLGRLYRSGTGETFHRSSLLKMILSAAISNSFDDFRLFRIPAAVDPESLFAGESSTALQAIQELDKCLSLPFRSMPNAHESLPPIIDALCSVLIVYGGEPLKQRERSDESWLAMKRCLAIAAVLPLTRLGMSHDMRLILSEYPDLSGLVPEQIVPRLVSESGSGGDLSSIHGRGGMWVDAEVAPFVAVADDPQSRAQAPESTSERTQLSFVPVISSILATLHSNLGSKRARLSSETAESTDLYHPIETLDSNFRALCFDALGVFVRRGVDFSFSTELVSILQVEAGDVTPVEAAARCECAASVAESLRAKSEIANEPLPRCCDDMKAFLRYILAFCSSRDASKVLVGCQALRGLVDFIASNNANVAPLVVKTLLDRVKDEMESSIGDGKSVLSRAYFVAESLLSLLCDVLSTLDVHDESFLPSTMLSQAFDVCLDASALAKAEQCRELGVRLVGVLLMKLDVESIDAEARESIQKRLDNGFANMITMSEAQKAEGTPWTEAFREDGIKGQCMIVGDLIAQYRWKRPSPPRARSFHEFMARETDNINRFVVEEADTEHEGPYSAWLCGECTLVTFRLGSLESRYRGWLEVMIRSPTSRKRRLIRLPSTNSLEDPESPSLLWEDPPTCESMKSPPIAPDERTGRYTEPSPEMVKAAAVMKKFDEMFGQPRESTRLHQNTTEVIDDSASAREAMSYQSSAEFREDARNIEEWLRLVLKDSSAVDCVKDELDSLGIVPSLSSTTAAPRRSELDARDAFFLPIERLHFSSKLQRAVAIVDRMPPLSTHKIALLFASDISASETNLARASLEDMLMSTTAGSPKFLRFTNDLGKLVLSRHLKYYSGGIDASGYDSDGKLSVVWFDCEDSFARSMVVFHVVPLMPEGSNNRKRHVGNDNVHVVYVEPGCALDRCLRQGRGNVVPSMVSGEFGFVIVFVQTLAGRHLMKVSVCLREGLSDEIESRLEHLAGEHIVPEDTAPILVRRVAIQADVSCRAMMQDHLGKPNWEERQREIAAMQRHKLFV